MVVENHVTSQSTRYVRCDQEQVPRGCGRTWSSCLRRVTRLKQTSPPGDWAQKYDWKGGENLGMPRPKGGPGRRSWRIGLIEPKGFAEGALEG